MSAAISGLDIPTVIAWITTVAIPAAVAIFAGFKAGGLKGALKAAVNEFASYDKLMTQTEPMTEEQQNLLASGKVSDGAWKMSDETFSQMYETLERYNVLVNRAELHAVIAQAESEYNVDYGICIVDKHGDVDKNAKVHLYISYGVPMYVSYETLQYNAVKGHSKVFQVPVWWHLTPLRKQLLLSEVQLGEPTSACVDAAIEQIEKAESAQQETYIIQCRTHYWVITRGEVAERGTAGDKI